MSNDSLLNIVFFLLGPFFGFFVSFWLEKQRLPRITSARREAITGTWEGVFEQEKNERREPQKIAIKLQLKAGSRSVTGVMSVKDNAVFRFDVDGAFYHNRYLRLNYIACGETENAIDFGAVFLILGDFPNKMVGKLAGYGSISETLIAGVVALKKLP